MRVVYWFRKSLRLHDSPALSLACSLSSNNEEYDLFPIYILDPHFLDNELVGSNRYQFLLESLLDIDSSLRKSTTRKTGLICLKGRPVEVLSQLVRDLKITHLVFEWDSEPFSQHRDSEVVREMQKAGVECHYPYGHTLFNPEDLLAAHDDKPPTSIAGVEKAMATLGKGKGGEPPRPLPVPSRIPSWPEDAAAKTTPSLKDIAIPKRVEELKTKRHLEKPIVFPGGETEALKRLDELDRQYIISFSKPQTAPTGISPYSNTTTVMSPYIRFGCVSVRLLYWRWNDIIKTASNATKIPTNLLGQLLFREMYYLCHYYYGTNFETMANNPLCLQVEWENSHKPLVDQKKNERFIKWRNAQTGFPWIDAIMTQLRTEGWIHHLARHATACMLTRGDLYQNWESGQDVFAEWLLDHDPASNTGNWMWLSGASVFFRRYFRVYSPETFGQKTDKEGNFIRHYLPIFKDFPAKYIYQPWTAPLDVQQKAGCVIGKDYPAPLVDHKVAMAENMAKLRESYHKKLYGKPLDKFKSLRFKATATPPAVATLKRPLKIEQDHDATRSHKQQRCKKEKDSD